MGKNLLVRVQGGRKAVLLRSRQQFQLTPSPQRTLVGWAEHSSLFYRASGFYKEAKSELRTTGLPKSSRGLLCFLQPPLFSLFPVSSQLTLGAGGFVLLKEILQRGLLGAGPFAGSL